MAYVYDEDGKFAERCNTASVKLEKVLPHDEFVSRVDPGIWHRGQSDDQQLRNMVEAHSRWTGSKRARDLLDNWPQRVPSLSRCSRPSTNAHSARSLNANRRKSKLRKRQQLLRKQ